jgi:hypothetical protein
VVGIGVAERTPVERRPMLGRLRSRRRNQREADCDGGKDERRVDPMKK